MRFAFIHAEKASFPISAMCRVLGVTRRGYYAYATRPPSDRVIADAKLSTIADAYTRLSTTKRLTKSSRPTSTELPNPCQRNRGTPRRLANGALAHYETEQSLPIAARERRPTFASESDPASRRVPAKNKEGSLPILLGGQRMLSPARVLFLEEDAQRNRKDPFPSLLAVASRSACRRVRRSTDSVL